MENFIVSARKYRPATFDMVVGQEAITSTLKNAIRNNQLAQAFLFCGPRGVGKTTCARILAKTINCFHPVNGIEPCNECESCVSFNRSASFNIHELDAASNNSVDDIRNLVDQVRIPPQVGKYKVYIIDEVHMLSSAAFNAFLKTLEEPPEYAKFILATTEKHKIIPTILSRCQIFDFKRITVNDIAGYLAWVAKNEGVDAREDALHVIAQKADGALRDALSFFDQLVSFAGKDLSYDTVISQLNILDHTYYFKIIDQVLDRDTSGVLLTIHEVIERGFDGQHFLIGLGDHLRNLLVTLDPATIQLMDTSAQVRERFIHQASRCNADFLLKALEIHNQCDISYRTSNNKRLLLELSMLQMCAITRASEEVKKIAPPQAKVEPAVLSQPPGTPADRTGTLPPARTVKPSAGEPAKESLPAAAKPRTISIRPENHQEKKNADKGPDLHDQFDHKDFDQAKLKKVWTYFTESIAPQFPNLHSALTSRMPVLGEDYTVNLQLDNKIQDLSIGEHKQELLDFLRDELKNYRITLVTTVVEAETGGRPFTSEEKYQAMEQKNPSIRELKEKLDLELEL